MKKRDVVMEFLKCFCAGDIGGLTPLLADDLQFSGPFHRFTSSAAYLDSLKRDPPEKSDYRVLSVVDDEDGVAVFYDYVKSEGAITVAQLCRFRDQKISEILLVFDGRGIV